MKVLFWGADEHCGTPCNMSAIASYAALANHTRSFLMQHKAIKNDLDLLFQPITKQNTLRDISAYYVLEGMDYLIYQERANRLNWESLRECLYSAVDGQIFYLPAGARQKPGLYPGKTGEVQKKVIRKMEELADVVFVDLGHNMDAFSRELLYEADVVVVNFPQDAGALNQFFECQPKFGGQIFYLWGNYDENQVYNIDNLIRIYRLQTDKILTISRNPAFEHACHMGRIEQYLKRNLNGKKSLRSSCFVEELRRAVTQILEVGHGSI